MAAPLTYRSIFLSDIHLGLRDSRADYLIDFLQHTESEYLYLVGDIIDFWKLRKGGRWTSTQANVLKMIIDKAESGTRVIYVPGNHDELVKEYHQTSFGGVEIQLEAIHTTEDGRKMLVLHGDEFDCIVMNNRWLAHLGSEAYDFLLWMNRSLNSIRGRLGLRYWSLAKYLKQRVKDAVSYISSYQDAVVRMAKEKGVDGVVCGHIHHATITKYEDLEYINCGDWVESCTAIAETETGEFKLIHWVEDSFMLLNNEEAEDLNANSDSDRRLVSAG
jgi:UDP-2,3-diacylglucosamine pyrophosphatase LpxH